MGISGGTISAYGDGLCLIIFCFLLISISVALRRSPKLTEVPRHHWVLLEIYSCSIVYLIIEECLEEITFGCIAFTHFGFVLIHLTDALVLVMYYLRLSVFFGGALGFYSDLIRFGCRCLVFWPIVVGLTCHFLTSDVVLTEQKCFFRAKIGVVDVVWGGKLVPSVFFLLLFLLPLQSRRREHNIWKKHILKQVMITLFSIINDMVFALAMISTQKEVHLLLMQVHLTLSVLLTTFIFSDWRWRLWPCKYSAENTFQRISGSRGFEDIKVPLRVVSDGT